MEDTLRAGYAVAVRATQNSLNPCFNGRYSQRDIVPLNIQNNIEVLILVLMEDTLRVSQQLQPLTLKAVLILVLMEDTLRAIKHGFITKDVPSLNPCFNGRYSQSQRS